METHKFFTLNQRHYNAADADNNGDDVDDCMVYKIKCILLNLNML